MDTTARASKSPSKSPKSPSKSPSRSPGATGHQEPPTTIEADTESVADFDNGDTDSVFSEAPSTASTSVSSSVRDYVFENNRRYHKFKEGQYLVPNDEPEQEREDMKHSMTVSVCDGQLHFAPVVNPQRVLDIGTGTGIWAIDMGDEYPEAEVIGIDLSPIQPTWVPPNVRFMVDDAESEWVTEPGSYDLIHARYVCMAIKDWPTLLQRSFTALKPGGWTELQELRFVALCDDGTCPENYAYTRYAQLCIDGFRKFHVDPLMMERNPQMLRDAGFENVTEKKWKVPIGTWPRDAKLKKVGLYNRAIMLDALQAIALAPLTRGLKWTPQEVELLLVDVRKSLMDTSIHTYLEFHAVYGQKPAEKA